MNCSDCGAENPENAVFCKNCGRRLDGMAVCPACGALTPADGAFCVRCGAKAGASALPLRFPAEKNAALAADGKGAGGAAPIRDRASNGRKSRILSTVSFWCFAAAALVAMIFFFLIGVAANAGGVTASGAGYDIFYFFGDTYGLSWPFGSVVTAGAAIGTVCTALSLAGTAGCFLFTVVRAVRILLKKTQKGLAAPASMTFLAYACGVALYGMCIAQKAEAAGVSVGLVLNGATVAGLVIGSVVLAAAVVLGAVSRGCGEGACSIAFHASFGIGIAACLLVTVGLFGAGAVSVKSFEGGVTSVGTYGIYPFLVQCLSSFEEWGFYAATRNTCSAMMILLAVSACLACALAVFSGAAIFRTAGSRPPKYAPITAAAAGICAVAAGIAMCVAASVYADAVRAGTAYTPVFTQPILMIVFGVLTCIAAVVYAVFLWRRRRKNAAGCPVPNLPMPRAAEGEEAQRAPSPEKPDSGEE